MRAWAETRKLLAREVLNVGQPYQIISSHIFTWWPGADFIRGSHGQGSAARELRLGAFEGAAAHRSKPVRGT